MASINTGKVVVGGLLAGLVFNAFDMASNYLLFQDDMKAMIDRLHLDPTMMTDPTKMIPWVVIDFLFGIIAVWTYAAMRPRFGAGPGTAVKAGLTLWAFGTLLMYGFTTMGVFTMALFVENSAVWIVSMSAGTVAGAWAYKED